MARAKTVNSDAYSYIRKRILSGEFPPGHPLESAVLSAEMGISRTPVRDALRQLEADGLVSIQPHLGASVKTMDLVEYRELCILRLALESHAAGMAAQSRSKDDLDEMRDALEIMRDITNRILKLDDERPLLPDLMKEDGRFHLAIISAARCGLMQKEILRLHLINRIACSPAPTDYAATMGKSEGRARRRAIMACHDEIFAAIEAGNVRAAKEAMEFHIQDILDTNMKILARAAQDSVEQELAL